MRVTLIAMSLMFAACYAEPPPARTPITLPDDVPGEVMHPRVEEEQHQVAVKNHECHDETSYDGEGKAWTSIKCNDIATGETKTVTTEYLSVDYGDTRLTRGQIYAMTDPAHEQTWRRYDELRATCQRYTWPRTLASVLATAGTMFGPAGGSIIPDDQTRTYVALGTVAVAGAIYAIGYVAGGHVCNEAHDFGHEHGIIDPQIARFVSDAQRERIGKLVDMYNAQHGSGSDPAE